MNDYEQKRATISFHLPADEKEIIVAKAKEAGLSISKYLRKLLIGDLNEFENIKGLLELHEIDDLYEVIEGWALIMDNEAVIHSYNKYRDRDVQVIIGERIDEFPVESKLDIILLKLMDAKVKSVLPSQSF